MTHDARVAVTIASGIDPVLHNRLRAMNPRLGQIAAVRAAKTFEAESVRPAKRRRFRR